MDSDELEQENGYGWLGTGIQMAGSRNRDMDLGRLEQEQRVAINGGCRQSTGQIMVLGPGFASLVFWALKLLCCPSVLGPKITFYWELLYKKLPIGGVVYMTLYGIESRRLYP